MIINIPGTTIGESLNSQITQDPPVINEIVTILDPAVANGGSDNT